MNKDIVFRGKSLNNIYSINKEEPEVKIGDLVYGDLEIQRSKDKWIIHTYHEDGTYDKQVEVDKDTVGQYTGLKDSQGQFIFEGDIFDIGGLLKGIITWHNDGYWCIAEKDISHNEWMFKVSYRPLGEMICHAVGRGYRFEVIGNIHEQNYKL